MIADTSQHGVPMTEPHVQGSASSLSPSTPQTPKPDSNVITMEAPETFAGNPGPGGEESVEVMRDAGENKGDRTAAVEDGQAIELPPDGDELAVAIGQPLPASPLLARVKTNESGAGEGDESVLGGEELEWAPRGGGATPSTGKMEEGFEVAVPKLSPVPDGGEEPLSPTPWEHIEPPESNGRYAGGAVKELVSPPKKAPRAIPKSSYFTGVPPEDSCFGSLPMGQIGLDHPREIVRIERDYSGGELIQFALVYPLELEGRITPTQFLETINAINELLISAHSLRHSFVENLLAVATLQLSRLLIRTHYDMEMSRLERLIGDFNAELYNPVGLNILWPRKVAFLFLEIEYY